MMALAIGILASGKPTVRAAWKAATVRIQALGFASPMQYFSVSYAVVWYD